MIEKLVFDQVKEQEEQKSITKEIRSNNIEKIKHIIKMIAEQTEHNKELPKDNSNLKDHIRKRKDNMNIGRMSVNQHYTRQRGLKKNKLIKKKNGQIR